MKIDLSDWNEYIADDVPPGSIPSGVKVEIMQILNAIAYAPVAGPEDDFPQGIKTERGSVVSRLFWRLLK